MSLWCLLGAPLLLRCDLTQIDPFTLSLNTNKIGFKPRMFGMWGDKTIRGIWRQQDLGTYKENQQYETVVNPHGVQMLRIYPGNSRARAVSGR